LAKVELLPKSTTIFFGQIGLSNLLSFFLEQDDEI
jgi:hypothetical protein